MRFLFRTVGRHVSLVHLCERGTVILHEALSANFNIVFAGRGRLGSARLDAAPRRGRFADPASLLRGRVTSSHIYASSLIVHAHCRAINRAVITGHQGGFIRRR